MRPFSTARFRACDHFGRESASIGYVTLKVKTALSLGFHEIQDNQPADVSEEALLALIDKYSGIRHHGTLSSFRSQAYRRNKVIYAIDPDKDVDGFTPSIWAVWLSAASVRFPVRRRHSGNAVRSGVEMAGRSHR
ncbi:MAG: tetrahydrofolate dehydrogenase/cyclohydrolase catalytic domain-containing protein [Bilophila wadsworthia]